MSSRQLRRLGKDDLETTLLKLTSKSGSPAVLEKDEEQSERAPPVSSNPFMYMDGEDDDDDEEVDEEVDPVPAEQHASKVEIETKSQKQNAKKANKKKNKKNKKQGKRDNKETDPADEDDEEFDRLLKQFQKKNVTAYKSLDSEEEYDEYGDDDGFTTADEDASQEKGDGSSVWKQYDLRNDPGFSKFKHFKQLAAMFESFDFKQLIPDNEFKQLFDDLSPESLQDIDSVTSTHVSPEVLKQIDRLRRLVKNWSGKDKRSVPNGGSVRKLQFTKIRDDWLPTVRGEFLMKKVSNEELVSWLKWQRPLDWDTVIKDDVERKWSKHFDYYKFDALNDTSSKKALTEFYLSTVLHPDHEALISIISSQFPYHVPGLLQVALICVRQGDKSNSNGLVERALFVFDRCLKNGILFNGKDFQLPYIYFYNRQFYLAIMRYIQVVSQRGAISTAAQWCKALLSLSPLEDPLGVRYFMDHYLAVNEEYQYIIQMVKNPLFNLYKQWFTLGLGLTAVYSYWKLSCIEEAQQLLIQVWKHYPSSVYKIYTEVLLADPPQLKTKIPSADVSTTIETKAYITRMGVVWKEAEARKFLRDELAVIFNTCSLDIPSDDIDEDDTSPSPFFIDSIPINLLRFAVLSQESSVMAAVPEEIWSDHSVFEFDVLPPQPHDRESEDVIETIESLIDSKHLEVSQMERFADEELLQQINQLSLQEYLEREQRLQQQQPNEELE